MERIIIGLIILASTLAVRADVPFSLDIDRSELLDLLDTELGKRAYYAEQRRHRIDSVRHVIAADSVNVPGHYLELGILMSGLNADSAVVALSRGYEMAVEEGDVLVAQRCLIHRAKMMSNLGSTPDAIENLDSLAESGILPENDSLYCEVGRDIYYTHAEMFEGSNLHSNFISPGLSLARRLDAQLRPESYGYRLNRAMMYYAENNDPMFLANLQEIASEIPSSNPHYSIVLTSYGGRLLLLGKHDDSVRYLALAAIKDIREADRAGSALLRLGCVLYKTDDLVRAHKYLSVALEDALAGGVKSNCLMISTALMPVAKELRKRDENKFVLLVSLVVCLATVAIMFGYLYRSKRRRARDIERVKLQLATANLSKDTYISEFMNLCSSYMESLEDFNRMCRRKITAGQSDDLLSFIKSGKIMDDQRKKFDDIFDDSFLAIYPTFVEDVNRLLLPDKQIQTPGRNFLTTELRVLAFTRLGVDDTAQVARFLGVTLNTVYTYRNKLRNKAISRETFDSDVMKIGSID